MPSTRGRAWKATRCVQCNKPRTEKRKLSNRGLCLDCATENQSKSARQMVAKQGAHYEEWKRAMAQYAHDLINGRA